jgi:hypothetical protein|tara:strand:+ start:525 stop:1130 length:606 start_codon:yes stop_codon:yes gene_type:complete
MRPKFIVYCLAAICLSFAWKGLTLTENINNTLKDNARQSESSIMEIGMCFDWYGVIIVNSVIKTSHGVITTEEMVDILEEERQNKNDYLVGYKKDITEDEIPYADFVFKQEEKISVYVDNLIKWGSNNDLDKIKASIPLMYEMTDPTIDAINNIMDTKMYYNEGRSEELSQDIMQYRDFMILTVVLCFVMCVCAGLSRRCA